MGSDQESFDSSSGNSSDNDWDGTEHLKTKDSSQRENKQLGKNSDGSTSESSLDNSDASDQEFDSNKSFDDGYDENLIGGDADKVYLEKLTEKEREQEIFDRMERRELLLTRHEIRQKLSEGRSDSKRNATDGTDLCPKKRRRSDSKVNSLNKLVSLRQKKKLSTTSGELADKDQKWCNDSVRLRASEVFSDDESSPSKNEEKADVNGFIRSNVADNDECWDDDGEIQQKIKIPTSITTRNELEAIRVSRFRLEKWVYMPFFVETVFGCYVRVSIGANNGLPVYRIAEIVNVIEGTRTYTSGNVTTNKVLRLSCASQERNFRIDVISNKPFTDAEFKSWQHEMSAHKQQMPNISYIEKKKNDIKKANNFEVTESAAQKIIEEKLKFRRVPVNTAVRKQELASQLHQAILDTNSDLITSLEEELKKLENMTKNHEEERMKSISFITQINERNRKRNQAALEEALAEEYSSEVLYEDDPFTRRKTVPTMLNMSSSSKTQIANSSTENDASSESIQSSQAENNADHTKKNSDPKLLNLNGNKKLASGISSYDLFKAHDFELNIDIKISTDDTKNS